MNLYNFRFVYIARMIAEHLYFNPCSCCKIPINLNKFTNPMFPDNGTNNVHYCDQLAPNQAYLTGLFSHLHPINAAGRLHIICSTSESCDKPPLTNSFIVLICSQPKILVRFVGAMYSLTRLSRNNELSKL